MKPFKVKHVSSGKAYTVLVFQPEHGEYVHARFYLADTDGIIHPIPARELPEHYQFIGFIEDPI